MRTKAKVKSTHLDVTLLELQRAGNEESRECVVLWLGRRTQGGLVVSEVYVPEQQAGEDFFYIPPHSMDALMARLKTIRGMVVAQVHSHPGKAFHSPADDRWAIVRHDRALSIVVPYFGQHTTLAEFFSSAKIFEFLAPRWIEVSEDEIRDVVEVEHES